MLSNGGPILYKCTIFFGFPRCIQDGARTGVEHHLSQSESVHVATLQVRSVGQFTNLKPWQKVC